MKIGIITQPLKNNYGGLLQNFALQFVLKRMGNEVITLDQNTHKHTRAQIYKWFLIGLIKNILGHNIPLPRYVTEEDNKIISKNTSKFIDKYIAHTEKLECNEAFIEATKKHKLDAIIVGSDQVWRPMYNVKITRSFLDFTQDMNIIRIAYAASFGVDNWEYNPEQTEICSKLAKKFNAISVREKDGISLCKNYLGVKSQFVLDPTMLLDKEDYIRVVEESGITSSEGDLFTYILDKSPQKEDFISKVATKLGLTPFSVLPSNNIGKYKAKKEDCIYPAVEQWLRAFMDAKFVICDSFHGAVFSIIFNKPFVVIGNKERGMSRFNTLFDIYSLQDRLLDTSSDISIVDKAIDWDKINGKRNELKKLSLEFIVDNLK